MSDFAALTARLNLVNRALTPADRETSVSFFPGLQIFLLEHVKLSFEYGFLNQDRKSFGAVQAEINF